MNLLERFIGWIAANIAESLYGGFNFDLDDEEEIV